MYGPTTKLKVWQVVVIGAWFVLLGIVAHFAWGDWLDAPMTGSARNRGLWEIIRALKLWLTGPIALGLWHWYKAYEVFAAHRADDAALAAEPAVEPAKPAPRVRPSAPPRLTDDPFRDPPRAAPILVERPPTQPEPVPIVPGDPNDRPKLLG